VPAQERRHGLTVHHPRFLAIPKLGMALSPALLEAAAARVIGRLLAAGLRFNAIDAHYFFPDGVAAVRLGRRFGRPVVVTARGSDISFFPRFRTPRRLIRQTLGAADAAVAVSAALKEAMVALGAAPARVTVLRNGVDTALFCPAADRAAARAALGLTRTTLLSVGLLIERKGHHRAIEALRLLPDCDLVIVGEGPERARLEALAARLCVSARVRLLGARPHAELAPIYAAADVLVLASSREGWANVLLEAMACGTPVVASPIWGNPEVVQSREAGLIARENTPEAIALAVRDLLADPPDRAATRAYAERFGWEATTEGQIALYRRVLAARGQPC
jgi:glycosyltransferase involved in cell wall biosynthesis